MTETYTTKKSVPGIVKKLSRENPQLDFDDELFYDFLKNRMDILIRQPQAESISKITSYSKALRTPL